MTWLLVILAILNAIFSFLANYILHFSALNIAPAGVIVLTNDGGNVVFSAIILVLAYALVSVKDLSYLWITIPNAILVGYLAQFISSVATLLAIYHTIGVFFAFIFAYFDVRYAMFTAINYTINYILAETLLFLT